MMREMGENKANTLLLGLVACVEGRENPIKKVGKLRIALRTSLHFIGGVRRLTSKPMPPLRY